mgnify:FL=1
MNHARTSFAVTIICSCIGNASQTAVASPGFGDPIETPVQERLVGELIAGQGAPTQQVGDQIGAFFNDELVGAFTIDDPSNLSFSFIVSGDDPDTTTIVE